MNPKRSESIAVRIVTLQDWIKQGIIIVDVHTSNKLTNKFCTKQSISAFRAKGPIWEAHYACITMGYSQNRPHHTGRFSEHHGKITGLNSKDRTISTKYSITWRHPHRNRHRHQNQQHQHQHQHHFHNRQTSHNETNYSWTIMSEFRCIEVQQQQYVTVEPLTFEMRLPDVKYLIFAL